jgi:hypothetical protein
MSLKTFHIFFITISVLFVLGFGVWLLGQYASEGRNILLLSALGSFLAAAGLVWYGIRFLKKLKHVSYI